MTPNAFDWVVFDHPNGELGLTLAVPEPTSMGILFIASLPLRRRRAA
jgi:hypothetical protein